MPGKRSRLDVGRHICPVDRSRISLRWGSSRRNGTDLFTATAVASSGDPLPTRGFIGTLVHQVETSRAAPCKGRGRRE